MSNTIITTDDISDQQSMEILKPAQKLAGLIGAPRPIDMNAVNLILALAPSWKESTYFGIRSPEQAIVLMAKAFELGFGVTAAFDFLYVISTNSGTRIVLSPKGALALIYRSGLLDGRSFKIEEKSGQCYVYMRRLDNGYGFGLTYTIAQAKTAGLVKPGGAWEKYEANLLRWRAIGFCSDIVFPDVKGGLGQADEYGAIIDVEGNVIS